MPPKNTSQRRSRKETLEEDLTKLIREENINDEEVFPILKEALSEGVDVNLVVGNRSLICYFAGFGMLKCFEECFILGADPTIVTSEFPDDALVCAVSGFGSQPIVSRIVMALLNHVKVTDLQHKQALDWACGLGRFEIVRLFLRRHNSFANDVLSWGVLRGSIKLVEIALEFNATVDQVLVDGRYLIHRAAEFPDPSILQKLLDAGADIEANNKADETPFDVAVRCNNVGSVKLLIDRKCKVSSRNALLQAIHCRSHDVLREFLSKDSFLRSFMEDSAQVFVFIAVAQDDLTAFKIMYPISTFYTRSIHQLVRFQKYDMLSAALFEFPHPDLSPELLTPLITDAPNDDFKALLQKKIDVMNGVDLVAKVKEEPEEEEELQSTSKTKSKKPTKKITTKSKKK